MTRDARDRTCNGRGHDRATTSEGTALAGRKPNHRRIASHAGISKRRLGGRKRGSRFMNLARRPSRRLLRTRAAATTWRRAPLAARYEPLFSPSLSRPRERNSSSTRTTEGSSGGEVKKTFRRAPIASTVSSPRCIAGRMQRGRT